MKRRSANTASRQQPEPLTYFTDRDLAKKFPARLVEAGLHVIPYAQRYPEDPRVPDRKWIRDACSRGWVCLTHDSATRKDEATLDEVFADWKPSGALFLLKGGISTLELAELFLDGLAKVERLVHRQRRKRDPFIGRVRRLVRRGGRIEVDVIRWANHQQWLNKKHRRKG